MSKTIQLKRSSVQGNTPTVGQLDFGEIGINTFDGRLFIKKDDGAESVIEVGSEVSELEKVQENGNTGWRLLGRAPGADGQDDYDTTRYIGNQAVDLSYQDGGYNSYTTIGGASGTYSHAEGKNTHASGYAAHAEGNGSDYGTTASGSGSHAEGITTTASGNYGAHSEGYYTTAEGDTSHAEGYSTAAEGYASHTEGMRSEADGRGAHAEGYNTTAEGDYTHAEGNNARAVGQQSHAEGHGTVCLGNDGHVENHYTLIPAHVHASHAEGFGTTISETGSDISNQNVTEGSRVIPPGGGETIYEGVHVEGMHTAAFGNATHAEGYGTMAGGLASHAEGYKTQTEGDYAHSEGYRTVARGYSSHSSGHQTVANNGYQTVVGKYNDYSSTQTIFEVGIGIDDGETINRMNAFEVLTDGAIIAPQLTIPLINDVGNQSLTTKEYVDANSGSISELEKITEESNTGWRLLGEDPAHHLDIGDYALDFTQGDSLGEGARPSGASGRTAFAEGIYTRAEGSNSHAEGNYTTASGEASHAEGRQTSAIGIQSHAEGKHTTASGEVSHAEGYLSVSSGDKSHAEGYYTTSSGIASHAEGIRTIALNDGSHAQGKYNVGTATDTIHETGIGTGSGDKKNAFEIYTDGRIHAPEQTIALHDSVRSLTTKEYVDAQISTYVGKETILIGTDQPTFQAAMDYTKAYTNFTFELIFPTSGTAYTHTFDTAFKYNNNYIFKSQSGVNTDVILDFAGTNSGSWGNFKGDVDYDKLSITSSAGAFIRYYGGKVTFNTCEIGNYIHIPYNKNFTWFRACNTRSGEENAVWSYQESHVEFTDGCNFLRSEMFFKNGSTVYFYGCTLGGADSGNVYSGAAIELVEDSRILLQHTSALTIQHITKGVGLFGGSYVKNSKELLMTNVGTEFYWGAEWGGATSTINTNEILYDMSYIADGQNPLKFQGSGAVEYDYTATASQTDFIISNKVLLSVGVFVNGIKRISTDYTITNDGTDTTVAFGTGLNTNEWVQLLEY